MRAPVLFLSALALAPASASAQTDVTSLDEARLAAARPPIDASTDLVDPTGSTRFHLVTRASFASNGDTFGGGGAAWTFEPSAMVRVLDGLAIGGVIPLTLDARTPSGDQFLLGNIRLSGAGGVSIPLDPRNGGLRGPRFGLGAGVDLYLPTHTQPSGPCSLVSRCPSAAFARGLRAYDPGLFTPDTLLARARGQLGFSVAGLRLSAEFGFTSGWYVQSDLEGEVLHMYGFGLRAAYDGLDVVVPFVELVGSGVLEAPTQILSFRPTPEQPDPIQLSFGARGYFGEVAPALFVTLDFDSETAFFGVDLAGILPHDARAGVNRDRIDF